MFEYNNSRKFMACENAFQRLKEKPKIKKYIYSNIQFE